MVFWQKLPGRPSPHLLCGAGGTGTVPEEADNLASISDILLLIRFGVKGYLGDLRKTYDEGYNINREDEVARSPL
jgi:hypothetical protein